MRDAIEELVQEYEGRVAKYAKYKAIYQSIHYGIGYPQILCSSLLTYYSSANGFDWRTVLGLCSTFLSVSLVFFRIHEKASQFNDTKLQYFDLLSDLKVVLETTEDEALFDTAFADAKEKEKFITGYAVSPSICCDYIV